MFISLHARPPSLAPSPFGRVGLAHYLTMGWGHGWVGGPGIKEGSESWTTVGRCPSAHRVAEHSAPPPEPGGPAQHAFRILQGGQVSREGPRGRREGLTREVDNRVGGMGGQGRLAALQAQNHKLGRLRGTERRRPQAQGDTVGTTDRWGDGAGGWAAVCRACCSQTVHPEGVFSGRVSQDHVWVIEHVQSVQGQGVNLEFVQWELVVRVEADVTDPSQRAGQFFREARRGLSCHCEDDVGDAAVAGVAQLLCVRQAPRAAREAHHGRLGIVERRARAVQTAGADGILHHVELLQLMGQSIGLPGCHLLLIV